MSELSDVYHLIYTSSAAVRLSQHELLELLRVSRQKNEARGLTGMLLYRDGLYLQFLEGPRTEVEGLLKRLRRDSRHESVSILREGTLPQRLFPEWSMAFKNLMGLRTSQVAGYAEHLQANYSPPGGNDPAQMLVDLFQELLLRA
jgi:Sensors of blue-light using FAD